MAHHTKEDCIRLGIPLADIKHRMTRRASWKKYWREGTYGITIHLNEDADLPGLSLGQAVGDVNVRPRLEDFETHPKRGENENPADNEKRGEDENLNEIDAHGADTSRSQSSLTEMKAPHTDLSPLGYIFRSIPVQHSGSAVSSQKCKKKALFDVRPSINGQKNG